MNSHVAGIILAAGGSARLGTPKQLLKLRGKSLINYAVELALGSHLDPVIVVLGAEHEKIQTVLAHKEKLKIAINERWREGQSTSLIAGLDALEVKDTPVIFLLYDQPNIPERFISGLIAKYEAEKPDIVMLETCGKKTPPILFSPNCFSAIRELQGDKGARDIIKNFDARFLHNEDESLVYDVDTLEDFARLTE